ncbi:MAG: Rieske 2Fe-2S domain-containing protein [Sandaracinaceae bacterium]
MIEAWPPVAWRDYWHVAIGSGGLSRAPVSARVLDVDLVLFRDGTGRASALRDRCPHRGAPLSKGCVRAGELRCPYHGWRFDSGGACTRIPSLRPDQRIPEGVSVARFPCVERDGRVWVHLGDAPDTEPPRVPQFLGERWVQGQVDLGCSASAALENFLDTSHTAFLHRFSHPEHLWRVLRGLRDKAYELRPEGDGFVSFSPPTASAEDPRPARPAGIATYRPPFGASLAFNLPWQRHRGFFEYVPTGDHRCRLHWMRSRFTPRPWARRVTWRRHNRVVDEDAALLAALGRVHREDGRAFERSVEADGVTLWARAFIDALGGPTPRKQRRVVRFRG